MAMLNPAMHPAINELDAREPMADGRVARYRRIAMYRKEYVPMKPA